MSSVLKPWVMEMPWKMQSILLSGLRAPDVKTDATKRICRWMRALTQNNADPSKGYMEPQSMDQELLDKCMDELEYLPCHYVHHFADALRVLSLYYLDEASYPVTENAHLVTAECSAIRSFAYRVHFYVAEEIFHFVPEDDGTFIHRHRDKTQHD